MQTNDTRQKTEKNIPRSIFLFTNHLRIFYLLCTNLTRKLARRGSSRCSIRPPGGRGRHHQQLQQHQYQQLCCYHTSPSYFFILLPLLLYYFSLRTIVLYNILDVWFQLPHFNRSVGPAHHHIITKIVVLYWKE